MFLFRRQFTTLKRSIRQPKFQRPMEDIAEAPQLPLKRTQNNSKMIRFNLKKLRQLNGSDKMDLMRDYIMTKSTYEAAYVYEIIIHNGFANRLQYVDHHNLFHLLISNAIENKKVILKIHQQLLENEYEPSEHYWNEFLVCCTKWNDIEYTKDTIQYMLDKKLGIYSTTWSLVFTFFDKQTSIAALNHAAELWKIMNDTLPISRPSKSTLLSIMSIYTKLGNVNGCQQVYEQSENELPLLYMSQLKRINEEEDLIWKFETRIHFFNAYLHCFSKHHTLSETHQLYLNFYNQGFLKSPEIKQSSIDSQKKKKVQSNLNTFHILFRKLIHFPIETSQDKTLLIEHTKLYWSHLNSLNITPDYLIYEQMITLQRLSNTASVSMVEEWYRLAITSLNIQEISLKRQALDSSYLMALIHYQDFTKAIALIKDMKNHNRRMPNKRIFENLLDQLKIRKDIDNSHFIIELCKDIGIFEEYDYFKQLESLSQ
ncbi:hypothetical protein BC833DRAFT_589633 [Globomyces pollinis-pini]|nr:hypothetical protein BC833DRAFT_589633 [Globomyces pollinis-pini]KAJ2997792.1 hypothetical protein HDV02_005161 [Globomyces sp. JEL0801]